MPGRIGEKDLGSITALNGNELRKYLGMLIVHRLVKRCATSHHPHGNLMDGRNTDMTDTSTRKKYQSPILHTRNGASQTRGKGKCG
jgi:hypothetical protein